MSLSLLVNDVLAVTNVCTYSVTLVTQVALNTVYYKVTAAAGTAITDLSAAQSFEGFVAPAYKAWLGNQAIQYGTMVRIINRVPLPVFKFANALQGVGTGGANMLPTQTSGILTWYTDLAGREGRGRIYPPFPPAIIADSNGEMTAGGLTLVSAIGDAWANGVSLSSGASSATLQKVIWHRKTKTSDPVTLHQYHRAFATQRRRGDFGRKNIPPF